MSVAVGVSDRWQVTGDTQHLTQDLLTKMFFLKFSRICPYMALKHAGQFVYMGKNWARQRKRGKLWTMEIWEKRVVPSGKQNFAWKWSCNKKVQVVQTYTVYLRSRISYTGLLLCEPTESCNSGSGLNQLWPTQPLNVHCIRPYNEKIIKSPAKFWQCLHNT